MRGRISGVSILRFFVVFTWICLSISCSDLGRVEKQSENLLKKYYYISEIHSNKEIWFADSLDYADRRDDAILAFHQKIPQMADEDLLLYARCRMFNIKMRSFEYDENLFEHIQEDTFKNKSLNYFKEISKFLFARYHNYHAYDLENLQRENIEKLPPIYQAQQLNLFGEYYLYFIDNEAADSVLNKAENLLHEFEFMTREHYQNFSLKAMFHQMNRDFDFGFLYLNKCQEFEGYIFSPSDHFKFEVYNDLLINELFDRNTTESSRYLNLLSQLTIDKCSYDGQKYLFGKQFYFFITKDTANLRNSLLAQNSNDDCNTKFTSNELFLGLKRQYEGNYKDAINLYEKILQSDLHGSLFLSFIYNPIKNSLIECHTQLSHFNQAIDLALKKTGSNELYTIDEFIKNQNKYSSLGFIDLQVIGELYLRKYNENNNFNDLLTAKKILTASTKMMDENLYALTEKSKIRFNVDIIDAIHQLHLKILYEIWKANGKLDDRNVYIAASMSKRNVLLQRELKLKNQFDPLWAQEKVLRLKLKTFELSKNNNSADYEETLNDYYEVYLKLKSHMDFLREKQFVDPQITTGQNSNESILLLDFLKDYCVTTVINSDTVYIADYSNIQEFNTAMQSYTNFDGSNQTVSIDSLRSFLRETIFPNKMDENLKENVFVYPLGLFNILNVGNLFYSKTNIEIQPKCIIKYSKAFQLKDDVKPSPNIAVFAFSELNGKNAVSNKRLPELPGSANKAQIIKRKFPDADIFIGENASLDHFKKCYKSRQYDIIHIALHGVVDADIMDDVKLYFKAPKQKIDSLYGFDLLDFPQQETTIILSSCESAGGKNLSFDGTFSLTRYFISNGAKYVCSAYNKVDDRVGNTFFNHFYTYLAEKKSSIPDAYFYAIKTTQESNNLIPEFIPFVLYSK
ncbi:MAG: CHAT domain-containing protein [Saprospiraceae bacterium]